MKGGQNDVVWSPEQKCICASGISPRNKELDDVTCIDRTHDKSSQLFGSEILDGFIRHNKCSKLVFFTF